MVGFFCIMFMHYIVQFSNFNNTSVLFFYGAIIIIVSVDCVVSTWSEWSKHDKDGISNRQRFVEVTPIHGGKECPHTIETKAGIICSYIYLV